jgi:hypothetical protein
LPCCLAEAVARLVGKLAAEEVPHQPPEVRLEVVQRSTRSLVDLLLRRVIFTPKLCNP